MDNPDQFLASSRSIIRQARRDQLTSPVRSSKLLTLILIVLIAVSLFLWVNSKTKPSETAAVVPITTEISAAAIAPSTLSLNIDFNESHQDWNIYEKLSEANEMIPLTIGNVYQIPSDKQELWNKIFSDQQTLARFAGHFASNSLSEKTIIDRINESFQTGVLNLSN